MALDVCLSDAFA
ncbi:TPA: hypothetical protein RUZ23_003375 [Vibrio cholerae]|nr:hypothetical protein [Vibrio cholerae]MBN7286580.1 hypothetical protein [Vibrio paracholerae]MBY7676705.1 hypothetical protein [Vibrio mimicus]HAS8560961.1 hypothetical protein [Vibrio vulnificus]EGQ9502864.1 hypothetical protein [Vibrio cholerae]